MTSPDPFQPPKSSEPAPYPHAGYPADQLNPAAGPAAPQPAQPAPPTGYPADQLSGLGPSAPSAPASTPSAPQSPAAYPPPAYAPPAYAAPGPPHAYAPAAYPHLTPAQPGLPAQPVQYHHAYQGGAPAPSGMGLASFILSVVTLVLYAVLVVVAVQAEGNLDEDSPGFAAAAVAIFGGGLLNLLGLVLATIGCCQENRRKGMAIAGLVIHLLLLLGMCSLLLIGMLA